MKYILKHPSGTYQINLTKSLEDFRKLLNAGKDMLTLFTLEGHYFGVVDSSFLDECDISVEQGYIPIENVTENQTGQGFLAMEYPLEKERVLKILKEMNLEYDFDSKQALEYFVTEDPEDFLTRYRNTTYHKGTFKRCIISESENKIIFITYWGFLIDPKKILFAIDNKVFTFKFSERYKIFFIPAKMNSENYNKHK
jgi:hypothetical protein